MKTSLVDLVIELYADKAPKTVENFLAYVKSGFYGGTIFHRVVPGFVIQGGGYTEELYQKGLAAKKETRPPIRNEADNGLKNLHYTLSMARTPAKDSATSQFFINLKDNGSLDHRGPSDRSFGYAVFGKVVKGMEVVDRIAAVPTRSLSPFMPRKEVPETPVKILSVEYLGEG